MITYTLHITSKPCHINTQRFDNDLQSRGTQTMISEMLSHRTYQILSPVLFRQSLYFFLLIHRIFYLLVITAELNESIGIADLHCPLCSSVAYRAACDLAGAGPTHTDVATGNKDHLQRLVHAHHTVNRWQGGGLGGS